MTGLRRKDLTREAVKDALARSRQNVTVAAGLLRTTPSTLYRYMLQHGIEKPGRKKGAKRGPGKPKFTETQIAAALEQGGNAKEAAKVLDVDQETVSKYMKLYGLKSPGRRKAPKPKLLSAKSLAFVQVNTYFFQSFPLYNDCL